MGYAQNAASDKMGPAKSGATAAGDPSTVVMAFGSLVAVRKSGLLFSRAVPFLKWMQVGGQLFSVADSTGWWIGDWLSYGEQMYQDRYREAIRQTSLNYQTLRNYAWVARQFDLSRRRDALSFGHHAEVAALNQPEQDFWLRKAEEHGWSRNQLRRQVRSSLRQRRRDIADAGESAASYESGSADDLADGSCNDWETFSRITEDGSLLLELTSDQVARFKIAASKKNQTLDAWALNVLNSAAAKVRESSHADDRLGPAPSHRLSASVPAQRRFHPAVQER